MNRILSFFAAIVATVGLVAFASPTVAQDAVITITASR